VTAPVPTALGIDAGLLDRLRAAGAKVAWRPAPGGARIAHLHDEEARVEEHTERGSTTITTDAGPVGALLIVLEIDRRGMPWSLRTHEAGELEGFGSGALIARFGRGSREEPYGLPVHDLIELARYALA
jgi:hypothetical protein